MDKFIDVNKNNPSNNDLEKILTDKKYEKYNDIKVASVVTEKTLNGLTFKPKYFATKKVEGEKWWKLLGKTIGLTAITLGLGLISEKLRDDWSTVWHGRKLRQIYATDPITVNNETSPENLIPNSTSNNNNSSVVESSPPNTALTISSREGFDRKTDVMDTEEESEDDINNDNDENNVVVNNDVKGQVSQAPEVTTTPTPIPQNNSASEPDKMGNQERNNYENFNVANNNNIVNNNSIVNDNNNVNNQPPPPSALETQSSTVVRVFNETLAPEASNSTFSTAVKTEETKTLELSDTSASMEITFDNAPLKIKNDLPYGMYARVYKKTEKKPNEAVQGETGIWAKCIWVLSKIKEFGSRLVLNWYEATSEIIFVPANSEIIVQDSNIRNDQRWIYYLYANNPEEAAQKLPQNVSNADLINCDSSTIALGGESQIASTTIRDGIPSTAQSLKADLSNPKEHHMTQVREMRAKHQEVLREQLAPQVQTTADPQEYKYLISHKERQFNRDRDAVCRSAMRDIYREQSPTEELPEDFACPQMGVVGSGGGFRAMLTFSGFLKGLKDNGLLDALNYMSGTSGSTWAMGDFLANNCDSESFETLPERIQEPLRKGAIRVIGEQEAGLAWRRLMSERTEGQEDNKGLVAMHTNWAGRLYATALGGVKFEGEEDPRLKPLSEQNVSPQTSPLPIFNAIATTRENTFDTTEKKDGKTIAIYTSEYYHDHVEITHLDSTLIPDRGSENNPAWMIPTEALGRSFENGEAKAEGAPLPISLLSTISVAGSAETVDFHNITSNSILAALGVELALAFGKKYIHTIFGFLGLEKPTNPNTYELEVGTSETRVKRWEEPHTGPIKGLPIHRPVPGRGGSEAILRDAGIDYNVPLTGIMRRGCGIAVVCDISGNLNDNPGSELYKAIKDAQHLGLKVPNDLLNQGAFEKKVKDGIQKAQLPIVFGDPSNPQEFCLIYCPCVKVKQNFSNRPFDNLLLGKDKISLNYQTKLYQQGHGGEIKKLKDEIEATNRIIEEFFPGHWSDFDPIDFGTFKLDYEPIESSMLHSWGTRYARMVTPKIKEIMCKRINAMNPKE